MSRIIELKWKCADCGTDEILGRHKRCPNCGSPREKGEMKGMDASAVTDTAGGNTTSTVTDATLLALALAGADWFCTHCSTGNRGDGNRCVSCGSSRYGVKDEDHPDFQGDHRRVEGEDREMNQSRPPPQKPRQPDLPADDSDGDGAGSPPPNNNPDTFFYWLAGIAAVAVTIAACMGMMWAMSTHTTEGKVVSMTWKRTVHEDVWTDKTVRLWKFQAGEIDEIKPVNGAGERAGRRMIAGSCRDEFFENERYVCGHHKECRDVYKNERESYRCSKSERYVCGETCKSTGNGFARCDDRYCTRKVDDTCYRDKRVFDRKECHTEPDYCTRPIYKERCDYITQMWIDTRTDETSGAGVEFVWGNKLSQTDNNRLRYSAMYRVIAEYTDTDGDRKAHVLVDDEARNAYKEKAEAKANNYLSWTVGQPVYFTTTNMGTVKSASKTKPKD